MESEVLKKFNNELSTLNDGKNLSKTKIQDITKAAIKAKASYKNVVFNIERLMAKSKPEQRISALYVIDSIIRASKHQLKEKDVYGPRFIKLFDRILGHMLKCGHREKYKTIRTMNLWLSNKVFAEKDIQPFRERCKKAGLAIEFEQVERAVKGSNADMSIYSGAYKKKEKTSRRSKASHDDGLLGAGPSSTLPLPDIPTFALSEEILDGTISEREMMELVQKFGIDRGGLLAKNRDLLQKTLKVFVATLLPRIAEAQSGNKKNDGNSIQNVLTKDFEYSDDEEEKEKDVREEEKKKLTHDEVLELAQNLLNMPTVVAQLHEVLNPVALAPIMPQIKEEIPTSLGAFSAGPPPNLLGIPQLPGFPGLTGLSTAEMLRVQNTQNMILQQRAAQALLQTVPVSGQHNLLLLGNQLMNPFGIPTGINPLLSPPNQDLAQQQQMLLNGTEQKMEVEVNSEEVAKQKQKESRERRKMGLPSIKAGKTIVASRTLWLKKIPTNVTENELKQAVETCGEATRVKIIGNRACAFVTMDTRRAANEVIQKLREVTVAKKQVKVYWARSPGMDSDVYTEMWEADRGVLEIPYEKLPSDLVPLCEGAVLDVDSLPEGKRGAYNEKGEGVKQANPAPPPPVPQPPPPLGFPFPVGLGQLPPGFNGGKPAPPGMHPLLNMTVPPPPGMPTFPPAPPPPGVGPPTGGPPLGFDPNKPPPMFPPRFGPPGVPPPGGPPFGRGNGAMPPFGRGGGPPPMGFRGRGGGPPPPHHFDARRGVMMPRPEMNMHRPEGRGRLLDQSEMWKMISSRERERSGQGDRRRRDDNPRRRSRWEEDDRNGSPRHGSPRHGSPRNGSPRNGSPRNGSPRRRSPERRPRRSPSNEQFGEPEVKRINADENEIVSSTTLDELNAKGALPAEVVVPKVDEDKTDDVPMDLE